MALGIQGSLFEEATDAIVVGDFTGITRRVLSDGAWVDVLPGWIGGAAHLFDDLHRDAAWRAERRQMYDRIVDVPRLIATYREHDRLPHHAVGDAMQALSDHYRPDLPEGFATAGLASTATATIRSPGMEIASGAAPPTTQWSPSSASAHHASCC